MPAAPVLPSLARRTPLLAAAAGAAAAALFARAASAEFEPWSIVSATVFVQDAPAEPPAPVVLQLRSGTRVRGTIVEETDAAYRLDSPELGLVTIAKDSVLSVLPADAPLGPPPAGEVQPPPPGLLGTQVLAGWDKSIALGFSGKSGNVDSLDLYGNLAGDYGDERARWRVRASYFYGLTEGANTKNEGFANARRDWLRPGPWFFWAEGRADYNEFKDYIFRAGGFAGFGYTVSDTDRLKLLGRLGAGASYEFGDVDDLVPEALASAELRWKLTASQSLEVANTLFPDLDELGEYRNVTEAAYLISLQQGRGLSLKIGVQNEYDSLTEDDSRHDELTYFGAITFAF